MRDRAASVGGLDIIRVLPTKGRRTVGPWCFVDCMAPPDFDDPAPMEVGPHPHIGLSTVTWLFEGEALHGDSLGTEQPIRPGQLNLMTAGHGIAHAELGIADRVQVRQQPRHRASIAGLIQMVVGLAGQVCKNLGFIFSHVRGMEVLPLDILRFTGVKVNNSQDLQRTLQILSLPNENCREAFVRTQPSSRQRGRGGRVRRGRGRGRDRGPKGLRSEARKP